MPRAGTSLALCCARRARRECSTALAHARRATRMILCRWPRACLSWTSARRRRAWTEARALTTRGRTRGLRVRVGLQRLQRRGEPGRVRLIAVHERHITTDRARRRPAGGGGKGMKRAQRHVGASEAGHLTQATMRTMSCTSK